MSNTNKTKRKRIASRYAIEGEIVAKSYVENFHKRKVQAKQIIIYDNLSYSILNRKIVLVEV